ncbi:MAG: DUF3035 domain-containing protein [Alphaproteobacteria bacterium]|jgi:hypothetical protein|nr:DUF3035 domain-containing protein [Rickettsiales bacterium]
MRISPMVFLVPCLMLLACSGQDARETLGLIREAPDEFVVVSRPPLTVPPDFELRPPTPGVARPAESTTSAARALVLKGEAPPASLEELGAAPTVATAVDPVLSGNAATPGESSLLNKIGITRVDPEIRQKLGADPEKAAAKREAKTFYDRLLQESGEEPVVDSRKEAERIRINTDTGKPVNEGVVPETSPEKKSVIDRVF